MLLLTFAGVEVAHRRDWLNEKNPATITLHRASTQGHFRAASNAGMVIL
jgi:hypothetical protein